MPNIIEKIAGLGEPERLFFINRILNDAPMRLAIFKLLNKTAESVKARFYTSLPSMWSNLLKQGAEVNITIAPPLEKKSLTKIAREIDRLPAEMAKSEKRNAKTRKQVLRFREVMKSGFSRLSGVLSDQAKGMPRGPRQKPYPETCKAVKLPKPEKSIITKPDIFDCIADRVSRRKFTDQFLSLQELSYLLWATQGVKGIRGDGIPLRTVPSAGCMHPFETYLAAHRVTGLRQGIYRYLPLSHKLVRLFDVAGLAEKVGKAANDQRFAGACAVTFIWSAIPYRTEWRYTLESKKLILQDSGHLCQNLYLACESIGCGTCAISAYRQKFFDKLCRLDGKDEFVVYAAPVGKIGI